MNYSLYYARIVSVTFPFANILSSFESLLLYKIINPDESIQAATHCYSESFTPLSIIPLTICHPHPVTKKRRIARGPHYSWTDQLFLTMSSHHCQTLNKRSTPSMTPRRNTVGHQHKRPLNQSHCRPRNLHKKAHCRPRQMVDSMRG